MIKTSVLFFLAFVTTTTSFYFGNVVTRQSLKTILSVASSPLPNDTSSTPEDNFDLLLNPSELSSDSDNDDESLQSASVLHKQKLNEVRGKYKRTDNDTGSPEFQVAGMTERILYLTSHLQSNPKDFSTRRGLVALVNSRRRLLNYLAKEDVERYKAVVDALGIRHRPPGKFQTREDKYSKFKSRKK